MTKDETLQLALDSMKEIIHWYAVRDRNDVFLNFVDQNPEIQKIMKSITAIKEALETKDEQRTWVGLTEDQIDELEKEFIGFPVPNIYNFVKAIEAKLKEKNHGNS